MSTTAHLVPSDPTSPTLTVRSLSKAFGPLEVLDSLSLDFPPGRITALLGPNGAGKTTLLKCLLGLVRPDRGEVLVRGDGIDRVGKYRHDIGFMPQLPSFPTHLTGRELAEMLDDLRGYQGAPDEELIEAFEIRGDMNKPFGTLSGGTRQKVNAALAFRYRAPIMILDEPTAGLDPVAAIALKEKVSACRDAGGTVIVTSHNLSELESLAEDVVFLLDGRVHFSGTLTSLLRRTRRPSLEEAIAELIAREKSPASDGHPHLGRPELHVEIGGVS